jgi:enamine deaminase RidA (YjgF/YER057c/UK114 family)
MDPAAPARNAGCRAVFGCPAASIEASAGSRVLRLALPVLAGLAEEPLLPDAEGRDARSEVVLCGRGAWLAGFALAGEGPGIEAAAGDLYRRLFAAVEGWHLYRVWNYVPQINGVRSGLENYRAFCRGRSLAFEERFGAGFRRVLPAASAVGSAAGPLALGFVAGRAAPLHFENPLQVPAFEYPPEYGPRPPSFSRATSATDGKARRIFLSGTAAVRGSATVAAGDVDGQLACTLENLARIATAAGAGPSIGSEMFPERGFKVYLRRPEDLDRVRERVERELLRPGDRVSFLRADICRPDLLVEIEATLSSGETKAALSS